MYLSYISEVSYRDYKRTQQEVSNKFPYYCYMPSPSIWKIYLCNDTALSMSIIQAYLSQ